LPDEVRAGRVPVAAVDEAVRRVLRVKLKLGLVERPAGAPSPLDAAFPTPASRRAAREVARETLVLLKNRDAVLPIAAAIRTVAVVGPLADAKRDPFGPRGARGHASDTVSILDGIGERAATAGMAVSAAP